jgi:outer membrane receptor protein involved in Fe transport
MMNGRIVGLAMLALACVSQAQTTAAAPAAAQPQTTEQVTVTANRSSVAMGETAKTTYVLDSEQLHDYPAVTLDESLRQHAGFELFRRAGSRVANPTSEGVSLRGLGSTAVSRTLVLEDGAPLNDPFGGWIHWSEQPQQTIEAVTLVSGGGSDLYGSSALGGVVDVIPATAAPARLELSGEGGSQSTSDVTGTASGTTHLLDAMVAGESLRTRGYVVTAPSIAGAVDVPANVTSQSYRTELGRRDFKAARLFATGNLLNESRDNGTPIQTNATRLWRYLAGYDPPDVAKLSSRVRLFGSQEGYRQSFSSIAADRNSETLTRLQRVHTQELGAALDGTLHWGHVAAVGGTDVRDIRASDNETPFAKGAPNGLADVTARQRFVGGFGEVLGELKGWSGAASLRADRASNLDIVQTTASSLTAPPNRTEVVLSPRVGLVRGFGNHAELHASGFRAFREPSMNELYRTGQIGSQTTLANATLESERATGWEIGTKIAASGRVPAVFHATCFWTEINRPLSAVLLSQTATTMTLMRENLGQIRSRGLELSAELHPAHALSATLGYQFARATVTQFSAQPALVGNWIPEVPRNSFTAQVHATSERLGELTVAMRASGMAFDDTNNLYALNGFFSLDVSGQRRLAEYVDAFFLVQNVTDQRAQVARTPTLTLGSPIFAEAGLRLHFRHAAP